MEYFDSEMVNGEEVKKYYQHFSVHGNIDRNSIELFFNEDENDGNHSIISSNNIFFSQEEISLVQLTLKLIVLQGIMNMDILLQILKLNNLILILIHFDRNQE